MTTGHHIQGAIAAAVTPMGSAGTGIDVEAVSGLVDHYRSSGLDGLLALGTTGEGILLSVPERRAVAEAFVSAAGTSLPVIVHCGAQTTADTVALSEHAAAAGAAAVAVIAPPYFAFDDEELVAHFGAAMNACQPLPFYIYEFAARSGYAVSPQVIERLRAAHPNLVGLKVSDAPWERFEPYLIEGLAIFTGPEGLMHRAFERGARGVVSGLAGGLPEMVAAAVRDRTAEAAARVGEARAEVMKFPFQAALKRLLAIQGVAVGPDVKGPLRGLSHGESCALDDLARRLLMGLDAS